MIYLKIQNNVDTFGRADYKSLDLGQVITGSYIPDEATNSCYLVTDQTELPIHADLIQITEAEYMTYRTNYLNLKKNEAQTAEQRITELESQNSQLLNQLNLLPPISNPTTLEDYQQNKIYELNTACNKEILGGFTSSVTGVAHQYKFDMEYQNNLNQEATMLALDSTIISVDWPTIDAGVVTHTREQFIQLCKESKTFKEQRLYRYFNLKAQVLATTTINAVNAFVW
jgi:hypothetical protein